MSINRTDFSSPNDLGRRAVPGTPDLAIGKFPNITPSMHADGADKGGRNFSISVLVPNSVRALIEDLV